MLAELAQMPHIWIEGEIHQPCPTSLVRSTFVFCWDQPWCSKFGFSQMFESPFVCSDLKYLSSFTHTSNPLLLKPVCDLWKPIGGMITFIYHSLDIIAIPLIITIYGITSTIKLVAPVWFWNDWIPGLVRSFILVHNSS